MDSDEWIVERETYEGLGVMNNDRIHPYSFDGIKDMHEAFMTEVAGAAEIPVTKLFGRSPDGMNATGEADMRNYYERIASLQRRSGEHGVCFQPSGDGDAGGDGGAGAVAEQPGAGAF